MATSDISRENFDPKKHYASVRMQQGRVLTDNDWNEEVEIQNEERRRTRIDIIGPYGSPDAGFRIDNFQHADPGEKIDFDIHKGILHLGGMRLEMEETETYQLQKDWLQGPEQIIGPDQIRAPDAAELDALGGERFDLVYLNAWQQPVSAVEDEALLEPALGGPDTTTRIRTMRRVKIFPKIDANDCATAWQNIITHWKNTNQGTINEQYERIPEVKLTVTYSKDGDSSDLCSPSGIEGYLGAENQAIRVQLTGRKTLTWGFDNAAPLYKATVDSGGTVTLLTPPKDQHHWPLGNQVVEVLPWSAVLANGEKIGEQSGHLSKIGDSYDPVSDTFTLVDLLPPGFGENWKNPTDKFGLAPPVEYVFVRIWDRGDDLNSKKEIEFNEGDPLPLGNTGLEIIIEGPDRVAGDYWIIAARPETPKQVIPWELEQGMPPFGVRQFFAPLALIRWCLFPESDIQGPIVKGEIIHDCRKTFRPLTDLEGCCTYTVGDGVRSSGDFNSIETAISHLPERGGKICVLEGVHFANARIKGRRNIQISGCGIHTMVRPHVEQLNDPIFHIDSSSGITIDNLTLVALDSMAILVEDDSESQEQSENISIHKNSILALIHGIRVDLNPNIVGGNHIKIIDNRIVMLDKEGGKAAIFCLADEVLIEKNNISVIPPTDSENPDDLRGSVDPIDPVFDPCAKPTRTYERKFAIGLYVRQTFNYNLRRAYFKKPDRIFHKALGGIQIGNGAEDIRIINNEITAGRGNGITFGHMPLVEPSIPVSHLPKEKPLPTPLIPDDLFVVDTLSELELKYAIKHFSQAIYNVTIEKNRIREMGLSGIGVRAFFNKMELILEEETSIFEIMIRVEDLKISENIITQCAHQIRETSNEMAKRVGFGGISLSYCENGIFKGNIIKENGNNQAFPVCGVFLELGDKLDISENHILDNGQQPDSSNNYLIGNRAGILIKAYPENLAEMSPDGNPIFKRKQIPVIKLHDNTISQPLGRALGIAGWGPMSITNNCFSSSGFEKPGQIGAAVFISNSGVSQNYYDFILEKPNSELPILPEGNIMFSNNQITLSADNNHDTKAHSVIIFLSLDDIAFNNNQVECSTYVNYANLLIGFSVHANGNRFEEGKTRTDVSLVSLSYLNTALGNQASHCLHILGIPTPTSPRKSITVDQNNIVVFSPQSVCEEQKRVLEESLKSS